MPRPPELVCPAGSLPALKAAIDNGADTVYMGLKNNTNARNFAGLNFDEKAARDGIAYAHARGRKVLMAINTYAQAGETAKWHRAVDEAAALGVDAIILADLSLLDYAHRTHPQLRLHLSVQGSATSYEAINFCREQFNINRNDGTVGRLYGFDIYEFANNPIYTKAGVKKDVGATADTGEFQCSFAFYVPRIFKATGSTKMYWSPAENDPEYQRNKINFRHYFICMPKKEDAGAVMMSDYSAS